VRAGEGTITTFDAPGAVQGIFPEAIDEIGTILGNYLDANAVNHGSYRKIETSPLTQKTGTRRSK
jgi:hypothetical protein